jgi:Mn-dependent DtxR family transcriptional regulator
MPALPGAPLSEKAEDYLERIQELTDRQGFARVSDLAEELHLGKASVSSMILRLAKLGLVNNQRYRGFTLTTQGIKVAKTIRERHEVLTQFFEYLEVSPKVAQLDIEGIEHHLSPETVLKLKALLTRQKVKKQRR